jgi:ribonuclease T2
MAKQGCLEHSASLIVSLLIAIGFLVIFSSAHAQPNQNPSRGYILHVQMTPAVCALDPNRKKQRKCLEGYALTVAGLVPEGRYTGCETTSSAILPPLQAKVVARIIPDEVSRIQLWHSVGDCMSMSAVQYFRTIINYAALKNSCCSHRCLITYDSAPNLVGAVSETQLRIACRWN